MVPIAQLVLQNHLSVPQVQQELNPPAEVGLALMVFKAHRLLVLIARKDQQLLLRVLKGLQALLKENKVRMVEQTALVRRRNPALASRTLALVLRILVQQVLTHRKQVRLTLVLLIQVRAAPILVIPTQAQQTQVPTAQSTRILELTPPILLIRIPIPITTTLVITAATETATRMPTQAVMALLHKVPTTTPAAW